MSLLTIKVVAALAILAVGIVGGLIPLLAARRQAGRRFLSLGNALAGGIFLGAGFSDPSLKDVDRPLEGKRFRIFGPDETPPAPSPGLWVDGRRGLAMLAGRCHNRPKAPSASRSVYRHGGLTLMEMLTPWVVLEPVSSAGCFSDRGTGTIKAASRADEARGVL